MFAFLFVGSAFCWELFVFAGRFVLLGPFLFAGSVFAGRFLLLGGFLFLGGLFAGRLFCWDLFLLGKLRGIRRDWDEIVSGWVVTSRVGTSLGWMGRVAMSC